MAKHSIEQFEMNASDEGEMVIPSEVGSMSTSCTLRQFMVLASRLYSNEVLENNDEIKLRTNQTVDGNVPEFLCVNLLVKPEGDLVDFVNNQGDEFFEALLATASSSELVGMRGKRGVFVQALKRVVEGGVQLWSTKILLSTTVFYNDYRATVGFPYTDSEATKVLEDMYARLLNQYPEMEFELEWEKMEEEDSIFA